MTKKTTKPRKSVFSCQVCGKATTRRLYRCEDHYACDDCGTKDGLCYYSQGLLCDPCHTKRVNKRIAAFRGNTTYTAEIVCPHCGYEHRDSWEWSEGENNCHDCERPFNVARHTEITYTTTTIRKPNA